MFRAAMMYVANAISKSQEGSCIVTGEALSQVASQTLESMAFTDSMSEQLVLRPLVGMDKQEIMNLAMKIGTYETSILPTRIVVSFLARNTHWYIQTSRWNKSIIALCNRTTPGRSYQKH